MPLGYALQAQAAWSQAVCALCVRSGESQLSGPYDNLSVRHISVSLHDHTHHRRLQFRAMSTRSAETMYRNHVQKPSYVQKPS